MMQPAILERTVAGEKLLLNSYRSVFWEKEAALIISDLHVGKTAHFRKNGIAIPKNILADDLERLEFLINFFSTEKIIITGDLLHAGDNTDVDVFCQWKSRQNTEFHLVKGNHDRFTKSITDKLCLDSISEKLEIGNFLFVHEFENGLPKFQITGHIHPGKILHTPVKSFRLPCFALTETQLLLPAFSKFTGLDTAGTPLHAEYFAFTDTEIFEV